MPIVLQQRQGAPPETRYFDFVYQPITDPQHGVTGIFGEGSMSPSRFDRKWLFGRVRPASGCSPRNPVRGSSSRWADRARLQCCLCPDVRLRQPEELIGLAITDTLAPESIPIARQKIKDGIEDPFEVVSRRKDGSTLPCEIIARETTWQGKRVRIVLARDLTETKRRETVLRESESRLRPCDGRWSHGCLGSRDRNRHSASDSRVEAAPGPATRCRDRSE
jgi:PAS domain-containing protein